MKDIHTFAILSYKDSDNLEDCIKSILNQTIKTNVIIVTNTKDDYIIDLASKYGLGIMVNDQAVSENSDYNFAFNSFDTELVTIAHQDDLYDRNYVKEVLKCYEKHQNASIIITDHYEIINDKKITKSKKLFINRFLIKPLKYDWCQGKKYFKMRTLKYRKCFCTSSVTFVKKNLNEKPFPIDLVYHNDWLCFINLAQEKSQFIYIDKKLVGYRIDELPSGLKLAEEDKFIYQKLWPNWLVEYYYQRKEKRKISNERKVK